MSHDQTKAWYMIQVREGNQTFFTDLTAPSPVGEFDRLNNQVEFVKEQARKNRDSDYRLVIKHETVVFEIPADKTSDE